MTTYASPTFTKQATHYEGMPCIIEPGESVSADGAAVTCASCRGWMPKSEHGCDHTGMVFAAECAEPHLHGQERWMCPCGYGELRRIGATPRFSCLGSGGRVFYADQWIEEPCEQCGTFHRAAGTLDA